MTTRHPVFDVDLYTDTPSPTHTHYYRAIRDLGPAVWLSAHGAWAIARFSDVRRRSAPPASSSRVAASP